MQSIERLEYVNWEIRGKNYYAKSWSLRPGGSQNVEGQFISDDPRFFSRMEPFELKDYLPLAGQGIMVRAESSTGRGRDSEIEVSFVGVGSIERAS